MTEVQSPYALSREALYELVWSKPMVQLARQFRLSDQGLRKICVKQQVPLPKAGHWAKVAVGHQLTRPALKPFSEKVDRVRATNAQVQRQSEKKAEAESWQPPQPSNPTELISWHPSLRVLRADVRERVKKLEFAKRVFDWEEAHPGKLYPGKGKGVWIHGDWRSMRSQGQLVVNTHKVNVLRVSLLHHERALRLLNAFAQQAMEQGYKLNFEEHTRTLHVSRDRAQGSVRLSEKMTATKEMEEWFGGKRLTQVLLPTGRLSLIFEYRRHEHIVTDDAGRLLEQTIVGVVAKIGETMDAVAKADAEALQRQMQQDERAKQERERLAAAAQERKRVEQLAAEEMAKCVALLDEAKNWRTATLMREYLAEVDSRAAGVGQTTSDFQRWRTWAQGVADEMDRSSFRASM